MKMLDKGLCGGNKYTSQLWELKRWTLLVLLLSGLSISCAQADLLIDNITQTPINPTNGQSITYEVTVRYSDPTGLRSIAESDVAFTGSGGDETATITIIDTLSDNLNITAYFSSSDCTFDQQFYCSSTSSTATFRFTWTPPIAGTYNMLFELTCSPNCRGNSRPFSTSVDFPQPVANAGPDQIIIDTNNDGTETVTLDATGSTNPNNDIVSYEWSDSNGDIKATGITPTVELGVGAHDLTLKVTDSMENTSSDTVYILINSPDLTADAGPDQTVIDSDDNGTETITLDASGSTIPYGADVTYRWTDINGLVISRAENPTVDLEVGTHLITLRVYHVETTSDSNVTITVKKPSSSNSEPGIKILSGENQRLFEGESSSPLSIRATGADGQPLEAVSVTWTVIPSDAATLTSNTTTTDTNGESSNIVTLAAERVPGTFQVLASLPSGTSARFQVNPLADISGLTPAQRSVANALDNACPALQQLINNQEGGTTQQASLLDTCDYLAAASDPEIISALQQFLPVEVAAQGRNTISFARIRNKNILLRLDALRRGASGPSFENISLSIQGEQLPSIVISELTKSKRGGAAAAESIASPLGVFVNGNISIGDTETTANEAGFDFETNGLTLGIDYRYSDQFVLGGAFNFISSNSDYLSKSSTLDIDGYSLSLYGSYYQSEQVFIDSILSIGLNDYGSQREFTSGGINHDLKGDTDGTEYALSLGGGYEFNYQNLSFVPQARVNYLRVKVDSYDETSTASGLNLSIDDQDIESLVASVSGNISLAYSTQYGVFIPYFSIEWQHEFQNDSRAITARFVNDPTKTNFSVLTDDPDQDYFYLGLGVSAAMANGKSAFLHYEQMLEHEDTTQYSVTAGFRLEF